jgi:hypothetical protein
VLPQADAVCLSFSPSHTEKEDREKSRPPDLLDILVEGVNLSCVGGGNSCALPAAALSCSKSEGEKGQPHS